MRASLLAASAALRPGSLFASVPAKAPVATPVLLSETDAAVLEFVSAYSSAVRLSGAAVIARQRGSSRGVTRILARIVSPEAMAARLGDQRLFRDVFSDGNTVSVSTRSGADYSIENILPEDFSARLSRLGVRKNIAFAHDAVTFDPATGALSDPFKAVGANALKVVNKTFGGLDALQVVLRGGLEAGEMNVLPGADFSAWKNVILARPVTARNARATFETFSARLAELADLMPAADFKPLLRTRLIGSSIKQVFSTAPAEVIAAFGPLRAALGVEFSDASIWLALLLSPEIESNAADGAATNWVRGGTRSQTLRSVAALGKARGLIGHPAFSSL